jgi:hypothetical protein
MDWLEKRHRPLFRARTRMSPTHTPVLVGGPAARSDDASFEEFRAKIRAGGCSCRERDYS